MNYLIDGHNLVPKIAGLSLSNPDDELRLIELLQIFCRVRRRQVEVFFDQAPPGSSGQKQSGTVMAHFVRQGRTADEAIAARLDQLGKSAPNWVVVSSDRQVRREARSHRAAILSSEQFAAELYAAVQDEHANPPGGETKLSDQELQEWLKLFGDKG